MKTENRLTVLQLVKQTCDQEQAVIALGESELDCRTEGIEGLQTTIAIQLLRLLLPGHTLTASTTYPDSPDDFRI